MNKLLLGAVGLSAVLASCGGVSVDDTRGIRSEYQLATDVRDQSTGATLSAGTYVICDNTNTDVELNVSWLAGTQAINLVASGQYYGEGRSLATYDVSGTPGGNAALLFTIGAYTAPLKVKPQALIVTPVTNVDIKGYTRLGVRTVDTQGNAGTVQYSSYVFPVVDCI